MKSQTARRRSKIAVPINSQDLSESSPIKNINKRKKSKVENSPNLKRQNSSIAMDSPSEDPIERNCCNCEKLTTILKPFDSKLGICKKCLYSPTERLKLGIMIQKDAIDKYALNPKRIKTWMDNGELPSEIRKDRFRTFYYMDANKLKQLATEHYGGEDKLEERLLQRDKNSEAGLKAAETKRKRKAEELIAKEGNPVVFSGNREYDDLMHSVRCDRWTELQETLFKNGIYALFDSDICLAYVNGSEALSITEIGERLWQEQPAYDDDSD